MRVGPEIKRGAGRKWEGEPATPQRGFDFLALFGSFWGDDPSPSSSGAKKNRPLLEVKLPFKKELLLLLGPLFQETLC